MSEQTESNERKSSGTTRLFTGFVIGALLALAPMYYFYMGREAALNEGHAATETRAARPESAVEGHSTAVGSTSPFASRMTYELSRLPEEPLPIVARAPLPAVAPAPRASAVAPQPEEPPRETRVADARPISMHPPAPRDRTAAIEQEAKTAQYREAPQRDRAAMQIPRVFEGREVDVSNRRLPGTPTKPITADGTLDARLERAGAPVAGVSPIAPPPEKSAVPGAVAAASDVSDAPTAAETTAASASVGDRLAATREWLSVAAKSTHTIQLMGTRSEAQLDSQLKSLAQLLEPSRLYVYRTLAQGKPSITVVYGEYADRKSALLALDKLPPALAANKPVLRTVSGIRAEMRQHKTDG